MVTRFTDRTSTPYAVPVLNPEELVCFQGLTSRGPVELSSGDPAIVKKLVARAGQRVKVEGRLDGEMITSDQGPTFPFILFDILIR